MHQALLPALRPLQTPLEALTLTPRGSWHAELAGGVVIELGRGEVAEVTARAAAFARTLPQVSATYQRALVHADLRHTGGYAVRLKGITTFTNAAKN
jgi:cell division protein FtsQ